MKTTPCLLLLFSILGISAFGNDSPTWAKGWSFKGDFRLRYQGTDFDKEDKKNRNRGRFRLRFGAKKTFSDALKLEIRFASGVGQATSTNQSFDESFSGKDIQIDRAFLTYEFENWTIGGGKMKHPFHTTRMTWDNDIQPEGLFQKYRKGNFYGTLGQFVVEEEKTEKDTNLLAAEVGLSEKDHYNVSLAYYTYQNLPLNDIRLDYNYLEFVTDYIHGNHAFTGSYVKNTSSEIEDNDTAIAVNYTWKSKKPYSFRARWARVEKYSALGQFTDSDFGFSDKEGFALVGDYKVSKYISWRVSVFSVDSIQAQDGGFNRVQLDLNLRY